VWYEWLAMTLGQGKVLLHLSGRRQRVVDADDISTSRPRVTRRTFACEAHGDCETSAPWERCWVLAVSRGSLAALLKTYRSARR
jgi:hypothetical protein